MWNLKWSNVRTSHVKEASVGTQLGQRYIYLSLKRNIPKFDTILLHSNWSSLQRKYLSKIPTDVNAIGNFGRHFARATSTKILAACTRVCRRRWRNFFLKIELLSHIMGTTPILEMARAYGLRPRLWFLVSNEKCFFQLAKAGNNVKSTNNKTYCAR